MRLDSLLSAEREEASLSVQPQLEDASRIQSRDGGGGDDVGRGRSARPSWFRRVLGKWKHPAAVEAPAPAQARERAPTPTETPRGRSSALKKAVGSALACVCAPVCSGGHDDDVVLDPRIKSRRRRRQRRRRRDICSGVCRSPPVAVLTGEAEDYWTFAIRGRTYSSLTDEMLTRRFVLAEDAMRRRAEMRAAAGGCWYAPGPSRLSQMSSANDDDNGGLGRRE